MNRRVISILFALVIMVMGMSLTASAGFVKNQDGSVSYKMKNGKLVKGKRTKIGKHYYYFDKQGKMARKTWVGKRYYRKNGRQVFEAFVESRYVGKNGKYVTGLKKIGDNTFYFNPEDGNMVTNQSVTIKGKTYYFEEDGTLTSATANVKTSKTAREKGLNVEETYYTDPEATDEDLLAAIIYCEAGNQPYDGQLAVGLVITNRVRSSLFPNTVRQVIYATDQFTPARAGYLTNALKGKTPVSSSARQAARQVLEMYAANNYKITNASGKQVSMKDYLFFMTPAAYARLGLTSKKRVLWDHVFFKTWS